jgi:hypothetical protein
VSSVFIAYWHRGHLCANILAQRSFLFFWSFRLFDSSSFPVIPTFRSFWLSGHSDFPVGSGFPVVLAFQVILITSDTK